ncbi:MAG: sigma-54-dependent Fis family transcriptional regulator, partial [Nitrospirae bacterium]|nr:sigma-54-dependent Fis family transcriptional regulator [Nitrospirota bacterium]
HFNKTKNKNLQGFSEEAMKWLLAYNWPGNIRELENLVERLVILKGTGVVGPEDLPEKIVGATRVKGLMGQFKIPEMGIDLKTLVDEFEDNLIRQALNKAQGVKSKAAQLLSMNRTTLVEKLKKKGWEFSD